MATHGTEVDSIRAEVCEACNICGSNGTIIYSNQRDRIFKAPGQWSMLRCNNDRCGMVWLNPMPIPADIAKAYEHYYTHAQRKDARVPGALKRIYKQIRSDYLAARFGYPRGPAPHLLPLPLARWIIFFSPLRQAEADGDVRHLHSAAAGRLLDVGCGSGDWLESMSELGWNVSGVDFDANAVCVGRQRGLEVYCGSVEDQHFPEDTFDAVTLNHVIEHLPEPIETLRECARVLRRGGKLVVSTPNVDSLSHKIYQQDWRGLEPPRHLHIFSFAALREALARAGMPEVRMLPQPSPSILYESHVLSRGRGGSSVGASRRFLYTWAAKSFATVEVFLVRWRPLLADAMTVIATKH